ncbi:biotin transporter BioY [Zhihengliuella salsuginis]|uniref:Biotin transporter n=1 Tax=Zhihengliuella salsuginis TaxID=578222 RepID=A0ABQ3GCS3_9MICC|nr:biotin transporter BioY [Zhihengliuella salsuginis]GHD01574.1 hypothetical protein GCM10008096_05850 [Zhihengliuella salsuginis]
MTNHTTAPSPGAPRVLARPTARDLSLVAVFAALIAVLALVPAVPVGPLGVPITLQTLGISLCGLILGGWRGGSAALLYLVVGLAGVPIFAKFSGGLGVLAGPTAGYLLSFPLTALLTGALATWLLRRTTRLRFLWLFAASFGASILVNHPLGVLGMSINGDLPLAQAFLYDLPYWPGDILKSLVAAGITVTVFKAFPRFARRDFRA